MWTIILTWVMNPKNLALVILGVCLMLVTGYAGIKYAQVEAKDKTIATQVADLKLMTVEIQSQKDQIAALTTNLKNIKAARDSLQKIVAANKKIKERITILSEVKDDGQEAQVYRDMFDFFISGGLSNLSSVQTR